MNLTDEQLDELEQEYHQEMALREYYGELDSKHNHNTVQCNITCPVWKWLNR